MNNEITLTDLFEVEMLQRIQDAFSTMTGLASIITNADGKPVTQGTNFTDFCTQYTRSSPLGHLRCEMCDKKGAENSLKSGMCDPYVCHAGLMEFAAPIMAGDKMIGCFVGGQALIDPPDITNLMQVAGELDIDLIGYLQSVLSVPRIDKTQLKNAASFMYTLTDTLSSIAYHKYMIHQANVEIEKVANMKSDFLANMSHEIRTPMNAVVGMVELLLREDMSDTAREYILQIKAAGKSLLTIINDILDFSKIDSGKMDIIETEYDPMSIVRDVKSLMDVRIDSNMVMFKVDFDSNIPKSLVGDSIRIKQIITNLCNNACKFTQKGMITLTLGYEQKGKDFINLNVSIKDTGIGIKEEDLPKLFHSFTQLDSKRNRNIEGTGLGLAICQKLLDLMDGTISVESTYGEGTTFSFTLPQKIANSSPSGEYYDTIVITKDNWSSDDAFDFTAPKAKVLVVDDNAINLTVALGLLEPLCMQIDTAQSGKEAILKSENNTYDLLLMDHMMPEMDGIETTHKIRKINDYYEKVPILALTANALSEAQEMFIKEGLNDFIAKPIEVRTIISKLKKWLPKEKLEPATAYFRKKNDNATPNIKIQGLDTDLALSLLGSHKLFWKVLKDYYYDIPKKVKVIRAYEKAEDIANYRIVVHAVKSSSKQVGAILLSNMALELEKAAAASDIQKIHQDTIKMLELYEGYIEILSPFFENENSEIEKNEVANSLKLNEAFTAMSKALEDLDIDKMEEALNQLTPYKYNEEQQSLLNQLSEAVSNIDIDTCENIIDIWKKLL